MERLKALTTRLDNVDMIVELILQTPVESLREIEEELVCCIMKMSYTLQKLEEIKERRPDLHQSIKANLMERMTKMQNLRRRLLIAIYSVVPENADGNEGRTTSGHVSVIKKSDNQYFRYTSGGDNDRPRLNESKEYELPRQMDTKRNRKFAKWAHELFSVVWKKNNKEEEVGAQKIAKAVKQNKSLLARLRSLFREKNS